MPCKTAGPPPPASSRPVKAFFDTPSARSINVRLYVSEPKHPQRESTPALTADANPQKQRTGLHRIWHASLYSLQGLQAAWHEKAFRQEAVLAAVLLPTACWLGHTWLETWVLMATVCLVLIAELLNSAIEATVDRIGFRWHALSKKAKDLGSAAVFIALLLCAGTWMAALYRYLV